MNFIDDIFQFRTLIHYSLHFGLPLIVAFIFHDKLNSSWIKAYLVMISGMLIDLDHLLASPIFDVNRCSIGFHPLHSYVAISIYAAMVFHKKSRILGIGLLLHILTDFIDCQFI